MSSIDVAFGNYIKEKRKALGLTQIEMAKKLNMPRTTYQHYEKGETQANLDFMLLVQDMFGISMQEFFDEYKVK